MRILHLVSSRERRGAQVFTSDLVRALNGLGARQRVAILRPTRGDSVEFDAPSVLLASSGWQLPGVKMDIRRLWDLRALLARIDPHVVVAHGGEALKYVVPAARGAGSIRVVYRRIGTTPPGIRRGSARLVYGSLMRRPDRVVAVAEAVRNETMDTFGVPAAKLITIPNAVDATRMVPGRKRFEIRRELLIPRNAQVVLSLGALTLEKDPLAHVEIVSGVLRKRPRTIHLFAGDGPMRRNVQAAIEEGGLEGRSIVLGSRPDVADLLAVSQVLLCASKSEGMPGALIEAGMGSLPVAGYAVAGVPEVVTDGATGLLCRPGDRAGLAALVVRLLESDESRRSMGRAARDRCMAMFEIRAVAARYMDLFTELAQDA